MADLHPQIMNTLANIHDEYSAQDVVSAGIVSPAGVSVDDGFVGVVLRYGYHAGDRTKNLELDIHTQLSAIEGVLGVSIHSETTIRSHAVQQNLKPLQGIKNIIAVASGKGGVGKSTTAVNLALALQADGASVGLLDADIYGPSQPRMVGCANGKPEPTESGKIYPVDSLGLKTMSMGYLVDEEQPMIWRGPMVTQALTQLLNETIWGELDYLVVDLPPGTGDIQLSLAQKIPVSGAVIVTTPQDIALLDARKGLKMFEKVSVPVLGVVENMSTHICSNCGHEEAVFGAGGGEQMASDYDVRLLGQLPLSLAIREQADAGHPTVLASPQSDEGQRYVHIARCTAAQLAQQAKDYASKFPTIVVENT